MLASRRRSRAEGRSRRTRLWALLSPHRWRVVSLATTSFLGGALEAAFLVTVTRTALAIAADDHAIGLLGGREVSIGSAIIAAGIMLALRLGFALVGVFASTALSVQVSTIVRRRLSHAYLHASWSTQQGEASGQLQQLLSSFTGQVLQVVGALTTSLAASLNLAALIVVSLVVDPLTTVVVFTALIVLGGLMAPLRRRIRARSRATVAVQITFANAVSELGGLGLEMQTYGVLDPFTQRIDALIHDEARARRSADLLRGALVPVYTTLAFSALLSGLALAAMVGVGELASLGAVMLVMLRSLTYGQQLQVASGNLMTSLPYLDTVDQTVVRYETNRATGGQLAISSLGTIDVRRVSFSYGNEHEVLHDLNFRIEAGETVGVIGPSGSGKSTLVQLLLGVRDPTDGTIAVGGVDLREVDRSSWAAKVAFVAQDAMLFRGTVVENVAFFRQGLSPSHIASAIERANLLPDLASMPDGLLADVGERGDRLSGGQRQRVSIARALAGEPQLLILDEPTSALDMKSESLIRETLVQLKGLVTVIVIAHRLSTLESCDRIMVIQDGHLRAMGTPLDLAQRNEFYREALKLSGMV